MPAFSFTAPYISPEKEQEEWSSFTQEERNEIFSDLHGTGDAVEQRPSPETIKNSLCLLREAMEDLPLQQKAAYLEALERAPYLVEQESPGERFLLATKCDPWAAAFRLVSYWKFRRDFFGTERAFRPMTLEGAMREDRRVFDLGYIALLEPDKAGRGVIYWNRIACTPDVAHRDCFLRICFYLIHVASENEDICFRGIVCLYNSRGFDMYRHFDRLLMKRMSTMTQGWPSTMRCMHVVTGSGQSVVSLILPVMKQIIGLHQRHRLKVHAGSHLEVLDLMGDYGLAPCSLPVNFGGEWNVADDFVKWIERRLQVEATRKYQS